MALLGRRTGLVAGASLFCAVGSTGSVSAESNPLVLGWVERALITTEKIPIQAKLDTGARTSSLHVDQIERFRRNGRRWVRFTIAEGGKRLTLEREIVRNSKIRRANVFGRTRPVVRIGICLGNYYKMAEVNLTNRKGMNYPLLIGRLFMEDKIIVHSTKTFTKKPDCGK